MSKADIDELVRWRDKCEALAASLQRKVRHCDEITEERNQMERERDEARAEVQRLTDKRDELLVRVADQGAELRATRDAYNGARTDVPALIARVRELEAELDELWTRYKKLDEEDDNLREALAGAMDGWKCR
jgi:chromosome segregation ATPase